MEGNYLSCLAFATLLFGYVLGLNLGDNCQTPGQENGMCIGLRECPNYSSLLYAKPIPQEILSLLMKARCGTSEGKPLLCCPNSGTPSKQNEGNLGETCQTPSGADGKCVTKNECPTLDSSQQSRCGRDSTREIYCCPPQAEVSHGDDSTHHRNLALLDRVNCGPVSNINILHANGSRSEKYGLPWAALIAYSGATGTAAYKCTGSLISKRYVLTAAHCLKYIRGNIRPVSVRLGELNLESSVDCTEDECLPLPQDIAIEKTIIHPQYKGWPNYEHDIALLRLAKDANLNTLYVKSVCLPIGTSDETKDLVGEELLVSGWCSYDNKQAPVLVQKKLKGLGHEDCVLMLKKEVPISSNNQLCTTSGNNGDCQGYGGSALVKYENSQFRQVGFQYGIASFGPKHCSDSDIPSIYTRVSHYSKWILDQMTF